jgi:hydroxymethylpyrimidine/phosphomethylpyrimidine kinase
MAKTPSTIPRILIIAGSDSGGGAGIQADIKTVTALGGYAMTAVTAITVQDTTGVHAVHSVPVDIVAAQIRVVLADIGADAIKTGMLHSPAVIEALAEELERAAVSNVPLVIDPVMVAKGGARLLEKEAEEALKSVLLPMADLVTPNAPEAAALTGIPVADVDGMMRAAERILALGARAVLVKGGHIEGEQVHDLLMTPDFSIEFWSPRIHTGSTHGTGCTLASAIACELGWGVPLEDAIDPARAYVQAAMQAAPGFGHGHGPLNHMYEIVRDTSSRTGVRRRGRAGERDAPSDLSD